jgi:dihydrofolate reductase
VRKVVAGLAITLDGVVEGPSKNNWLMFNDEMGAAIGAGVAESDAILLGTQTYLEFAQLWPTQGSEVPMADFMNQTPKYVLSHSLETLDWNNSILLRGDLTEVVTKLKNEPGRNIQVPGSPRLVRSLLRAGLLDELSLMVHPLVLGGGMRLFDGVTERIALTVTESKTFRTGVVSVTYRPENG